MHNPLALNTLFSKKMTTSQTMWLFLSVFIILRILSFATYSFPTIHPPIALFLIISFGYVTLKNLSWGWMLFVVELILDGSGHYVEFQSLILRTWFLALFGIVWIIHILKTRKIHFSLPRPLIVAFISVCVVIAWAIIRGVMLDHIPRYIFQDAMLYFFLFLVFPAIEFQRPLRSYFKPLIASFVLASALFSLITFVIYASSIGELPDPYYHWFRNIVAGKITDLGYNFYRIVLSEHIYLIPLFLIFVSYLIDNIKNKHMWFLTLATSFVLALNFTRIYFLAIIIGFFVLAIQHNFKKWFRATALAGISILLLFGITSTIASGGDIFGLEIIGMKTSGATVENADLSGAIRLAMLPDIYSTIQAHPFVGSGLATMVIYTDPLTNEVVSRTQFDWGYFEMLAELGIIGTLIFLSFLVLLLFYIARLAYGKNIDQSKKPLYRGLFAGGISLFVINITTPALFQGFGVLYFVFIMTILSATFDRNTDLTDRTN